MASSIFFEGMYPRMLPANKYNWIFGNFPHYSTPKTESTKFAITIYNRRYSWGKLSYIDIYSFSNSQRKQLHQNSSNCSTYYFLPKVKRPYVLHCICSCEERRQHEKRHHERRQHNVNNTIAGGAFDTTAILSRGFYTHSYQFWPLNTSMLGSSLGQPKIPVFGRLLRTE